MTNSVAFLSHVDFIVVLSDGQISEQGTYKELLSHHGPFADFIATYLTEADEDSEEEEGRESKCFSYTDSLSRPNNLVSSFSAKISDSVVRDKGNFLSCHEKMSSWRKDFACGYFKLHLIFQ